MRKCAGLGAKVRGRKEDADSEDPPFKEER